jgi:hypothetical protein
VLDYSTTHVYPEVLPRRAGEMLEHWLDQEPAENAERVPVANQRFPTPVGAAVEFAESTFKLLEENRHDMPIDLVIAAKQMATSVALVVTLLDAPGPVTTAAERADAERQARRGAVAAVGRFAVELERVRPDLVHFDLPDYAFAAGETFQRRALGLDGRLRSSGDTA